MIGLFVVVRGVEKLGFAAAAAAWLARHEGAPITSLVASAAGTAAAANAMNNLPAALLARSVIGAARAGEPAAMGALLGADIGPNLLPFGSLATMLVLSVAREGPAHPGDRSGEGGDLDDAAGAPRGRSARSR